jgi:hypothetical protein
MKYTLVKGTSLSITEKVNGMLQQGWQPLGAPFIDGGYVQAMIHYGLNVSEESPEERWARENG